MSLRPKDMTEAKRFIVQLEAQRERENKLILEMKDEISKLKMTVNSLRQKLKARQ